MSVKHIDYRRANRSARRLSTEARAWRQYKSFLRGAYLARAARDEERRGHIASYCADAAEEQERARYRAAQELAVLGALLDKCDECGAFGPTVEDLGQPVCMPCAERARYGEELESEPAEYWWEQARRAESAAEFAEENAETFHEERQRFLAEARAWRAYALACEDVASSY